MVTLSREQRLEIVDILADCLPTSNERRSAIAYIFSNSGASASRFTVDGQNAYQASSQLVNELMRYGDVDGKPALWYLLDYMK